MSLFSRDRQVTEGDRRGGLFTTHHVINHPATCVSSYKKQPVFTCGSQVQHSYSSSFKFINAQPNLLPLLSSSKVLVSYVYFFDQDRKNILQT